MYIHSLGILNIGLTGGIYCGGKSGIAPIFKRLTRLSSTQFIFSMLFVPPSLRYLERLWGSIETLKFIVVTIVFSNIITFGLSWIEAFLFGKPELFLYVTHLIPLTAPLRWNLSRYQISYHGQMALQIGLMVAFTQVIPEYQVQLMGVIRAKVKVSSIPAFVPES